MNTKDLSVLYDAGMVRQIPEDRIIHFGGSSVKYIYFLRKGMMKIAYMNGKGKEVIKDILQPGNIFGELALLENEESADEFAVALDPCEVVFIPVENVKKMMQGDAQIMAAINRVIGKRMKRLEERMFALIFKNVKERVYDFLKEFARDFGTAESDGFRARNFLTHEDIAKLTTSSRQTVTESLGYLKKKGLIDYNSRILKVYN